MTEPDDLALSQEEIEEEINIIEALGLLDFVPSRVAADELPPEEIVGTLLGQLSEHIHRSWRLVISTKPSERADGRKLLEFVARAVSALSEEYLMGEKTEISSALIFAANRKGR